MVEFTPKWDIPDIGVYIWPVSITSCEFKSPPEKKPYMLLGAVVDEGDRKGFEFDFKVWISPKARNICLWFLKKFSYPDDLLQRKPPVLKSESIVGLKGKVSISVEEDRQGFLDFKAVGFERPGETELEERQESREELMEIDLEGDIKEFDPFAGLL